MNNLTQQLRDRLHQLSLTPYSAGIRMAEGTPRSPDACRKQVERFADGAQMIEDFETLVNSLGGKVVIIWEQQQDESI